MNFKDFYLLGERQYFNDLLPKIDKILDNIKIKIQELTDFKSGDSINVELEEGVSVPIIFFKNKSKTYLTYHLKSKKDVLGSYFNGRIEVYLSRIFPDRIYGKINPFKLVKSLFPAELQNTLRHELVHAYEDLVSKILYYNIPEDETPDKYTNSSAELNAHLIQWIGHAYNHNRIFKKLIERKDIFRAVLMMIRSISNQSYIKHLTADNKKWLYKNIYQIISDLID